MLPCFDANDVLCDVNLQYFHKTSIQKFSTCSFTKSWRHASISTTVGERDLASVSSSIGPA